MTLEVSLTVLKTFKATFYSFTKTIICDDEKKIILKFFKCRESAPAMNINTLKTEFYTEPGSG